MMFFVLMILSLIFLSIFITICVFILFFFFAVKLLANYAERTVTVEQVGQRPSGLNGFKTDKGIKMTAQHGDRLEMVYGKYPYKIEFNPSPTKTISPRKIKKRLISQESEDEDESLSLKKSKFISDLSDKFDIDESIKTETKADSVEKKVGKVESSSNSVSKMSDSSESGTWEYFDKTLYVYTSQGCEGRPKVIILFKTSYYYFD